MLLSNKTNAVTELLTQYRGRLILTYGLSITEQVLGLLLPLAIGNAINGLLGNDFLPWACSSDCGWCWQP
jgi:hypothetical protein